MALSGADRGAIAAPEYAIAERRSPLVWLRGRAAGTLRDGPFDGSNVDAPMKRLAMLLGVFSAVLSALVVRPVNSYQGFIVKSTATAQTPALTVLGVLAAVLGAVRRSRFAVIAGVLGASVGMYYISRVTRSHDGHERAFGLDWRQRIGPDAERRMLQRRRSLRLPRVPAPSWARDVPFWTIPGSDRELLADIWEPAAGVERTGTAIVYLYGGSWHFFDKDVLTRPLFQQLTAQGHVVMDAAHRSCPETDVIGMVGDVHRAVAWIKANAERYGIDPGRVVVMGGSSGAHIALLAAYAPHEPKFVPEELRAADMSVMAVVSWYGIPEMESAVERWLGQEGATSRPQVWDRKEPGKLANLLNSLMLGRPLAAAQSPPAPPVRQLVRNLLGVEPGDAAEAMYDLASPIHHVTPACPPTLMFQGTHDAVVPLEAARRLHRSLEAAGVPVVYVEYIWTEHAFDGMYPPLANPAAKAALYDLERFLVTVARTQAKAEAAAGVAPPGEPEELRSLADTRPHGPGWSDQARAQPRR
jgi:acetyl esterase/lipase